MHPRRPGYPDRSPSPTSSTDAGPPPAHQAPRPDTAPASAGNSTSKPSNGPATPFTCRPQARCSPVRSASPKPRPSSASAPTPSITGSHPTPYRCARGNRIAIGWTPEIEKNCQQKISQSHHLKPAMKNKDNP